MRPSDCHPDRPHYGHGLCKLCYQKQYHKNNRDKMLARLRERYAMEPEYKKKRKAQAWAAQVQRLYGLSAEAYWKMYEAQEGKCKLCLTEVPPGKHLSVDHDHSTNEVRGLLCVKCNSSLGYLENQEWLGAALRHVHKSGHPEFDKIALQAMDLHARKNHDYARGGDPLGNFKRVAEILGQYWPVPFATSMGPAVVAFIYAIKQVDATGWAMAQGGENICEGLDGRQFDRAVYALLELILTKEAKKETKE